jgi:hypothetical protein
MLAFWATNEVARDIEAPFLYAPNDLPLARVAHAFCERLLATSAATAAAAEAGELAWDGAAHGAPVS